MKKITLNDLQKIEMIVSKEALETVDLSNENVDCFTYKGIQVFCPPHQVKACKMILDTRFNRLWAFTKIVKQSDVRENEFTIKAYVTPLKGWYNLKFYFAVGEQRVTA